MPFDDSPDALTVTEIVLPGRVEPAGLQTRHRPRPTPGPGEALVRMEASGVSFAEQGMRRGRYPGQPRFPFVLGYDVVGTVEQVGPDADPTLVGRRVAAVTKTGGWATHQVIGVVDLLPVPDGLDPAEVEAVLVNGVTAWQMLHRSARVRPGATVLVHGASGGVGTVLVQLAVHAGARVIGTAAPRHHEALRALGVTPVDYAGPDLTGRIRTLAPDGVDAVFDHLGPASLPASFGLLARGGTLVAYGTAQSLDDDNSVVWLFLQMLTRIIGWSLLPNGRRAGFYNFWAGHLTRRGTFRRRLRDDLAAVLDLLARGVVVPHIAARFPLTDAAAAMELAESHTVRGKVVLVP